MSTKVSFQFSMKEDKGIRPIRTHKLATLRAICSTGSPLKPNSYDYVYRDIKTDVLLASISGGTDIIACFMGENSTLPVHRGEIQSPHLVRNTAEANRSIYNASTETSFANAIYEGVG